MISATSGNEKFRASPKSPDSAAALDDVTAARRINVDFV